MTIALRASTASLPPGVYLRAFDDCPLPWTSQVSSLLTTFQNFVPNNKAKLRLGL